MAIDTMGGVNVVEQPSLERLKALDTLPDLPSQIAEAHRLCNHPARADMVAKWLLDKLKKSSEVRLDPRSWSLLSGTIRILSPERAATLLTSGSIIDTLLAATEDDKASESLFHSIAVFVGLLLEISAGSGGTSIKALLSLPSSQAARLLGVWLRNAISKSKSNFSLRNNRESSLRTGSQIWSLRKHSVNENEDFASHCLAPAALLLGVHTSQAAESPPSSKRRVNDGDKLRSNLVEKELEALLARHMFLPARTEFYKAQSGSSNPTASMETLINPLKVAVQEDQLHLKAIPSLLDIALRCIATPTQRQRTKEKPWIEAVFQTLHDCNKASDSGAADLTILLEMLQVIAKRAALSSETLKRLVWNYSILSVSQTAEDWREQCTAEHWTIISQVLTMESDIFAEPVMADAIFIRISRASRMDTTDVANKIAELTDVANIDDQVNVWHSKWVTAILVPIMKAFARRRDLPTFVKLWSEQLEQEFRSHIWSPWVELDGYLHMELEDSMTENQIVELFDLQAARIVPSSEAEGEDPESTLARKFESIIVILNGILGNFRSESLENVISSKCEGLFEKLLERFRTSSAHSSDPAPKTIRVRRIWSLLVKALEFWLPAWVEKRSGGDIAEKCGSLVSHVPMKVALAAAREMRENKKASPASIMEASDAECFIGSICHHFMPYEGSMDDGMRSTLLEMLESLFRQLDPGHLQVFCLYGDLFSFLRDSEICHKFLKDCLTYASKTDSHPSYTATCSRALRAIVTTAVHHAHASILDDIVSHAIEITVEPRAYNETAVMSLLLDIPVSSLTRAQRERILDALSTGKANVDAMKQAYARRRLALAIKLMEVSNASSQLSTDHTTIWRIVLGVSATEYVDAQSGRTDVMEDSETVSLVEELARLVAKHLLATQDQERSRSTLIALSEDAKIVLESCCAQQHVDVSGPALALSTAILRELEIGAKEGLKSQLAHRSEGVIQDLLDRLPARIQDIIPAVNVSSLPAPDSQTATSLKALFDTLAIVLDLAVSIPLNVSDASYGAITKSVTLYRATLPEPRITVHEDAMMPFNSALVRCFAIRCKHDALDDSLGLIDFGLHLLELRLQPTDINSTLDAFSNFVRRLGSVARVHATENLFAALNSRDLSSLLLLEICLSKLEKDDSFEGSFVSQHQVLSVLLRVLADAENVSKQEQLTTCILLVLRQKLFLTNQYTIDLTLSNLPKLFKRSPSDSQNFLDVCRILSALLLNHRARLQGRFHLVNKVYQDLVSQLFTPHKEPTLRRNRGKVLGLEHASALSRMLMLFCEPLLLRRQANATSLTDESRKEQAHVGRFVQNVLHHYCSQILSGTLADGVSDALKPGLRSMIEAIEMNDADGIKHLSASMSNSERAVLRGVYDDWRRFGKWRGG